MMRNALVLFDIMEVFYESNEVCKVVGEGFGECLKLEEIVCKPTVVAIFNRSILEFIVICPGIVRWT